MQRDGSDLCLRPLISGARTTAGTLLGFTVLPMAALAQEADSANTSTTRRDSPNVVELDTVEVQAAEQGNTNFASLGIARLPTTVQDTPQTITVVPQELIQQQQITTLGQALQNVPGITMSSGEGNGGPAGDQFRIRGIPARGDIYSDGLRDFGIYTHDMFDTESVEVIMGPNGEAFGVGNAGGLINQTTKRAHRGNVTSIDQQLGSGPLYRTTIDGNYQIDEKTAIRLNAVYNKQDVADRNNIFTDRAGIAANIGFGLGTDTTWFLNYMYLHGDSMPDMGVPFVTAKDGIVRPITDFGLVSYDSATSYARSFNRDITDVQVVTSNFSKEVNNWFTFNNDTRFSVYARDFSATNPSACTGTCAATILSGGNYRLSYGAGGGMTYNQTGWGFQNVASGRFEFSVGGFKNKAIVGIDTVYQEDQRHMMTAVNRVNDQMIINPRYLYPQTWFYYNGVNARLANATDIGLFASDRLWFTEQLSVQAGVRWDYFNSEFNGVVAGIGGSQSAQEFSPAVSIIYEPSRNYTYYASFSRTYRPIGTDVAAATGGSGSEVPQDTVNSEPESSDLYELGVKANFLNGRLGATAAVFRVDKENSYAVDPTTGDITPGFSDAGLGLRVQGVQLGLNGLVTQQWMVNLGYSYLDGETTYSSTIAQIGNVAPNVPTNNFSAWTSYDLETLVHPDTKLMVGGGVRYASAYWSDAANTGRVPETFSLDAMVSLETHDKKLRMALNAYNLTDHQNYTSSFNVARVVPASGRTFMFNIGTTF
ncbi:MULTISPECIES: TonB-dependent receptor [unclassified Xanthobacter]|uniref:TonB-dependent receptor n=1 Tax=unclassified Xanthobacter TaxID=2623496 RepID=UPI001EDE2D1C|nr:MULTISPECIES: TonB-dependent receptor [unclassified Xanthobacter]